MPNLVRLVFALLMLVSSACSINHEERLASARKVVESMRFQKTLELSKQHPPDTGVRDREAANRCYRETDTAPLVEKVARLYADTFSIDELNELEQFYQSAVGQRGVRDDIAQGYRRRRLVPPDPVVLSAAEIESIRAFFRSPTGQKLAVDSKLQEAVATELHFATKAMLLACDQKIWN